jgi:hypothetical protein
VCIYFFKGTAEKFAMVDVSEVILIKPGNILEFLKTGQVPLQNCKFFHCFNEKEGGMVALKIG